MCDGSIRQNAYFSMPPAPLRNMSDPVKPGCGDAIPTPCRHNPAVVHGGACEMPVACLPSAHEYARAHPMTRSLQGFLDSGETLERLHDHALRLQRLQALLHEMLPAPLNTACSVANLKGETLVLLTRSGAVAARLKQTVPTLLQRFAESGVALTAIQVKVGIGSEPEPGRPPTVRTLPDTARESLESLSASLPEGAPLRESIRRLIDRSRRGS